MEMRATVRRLRHRRYSNAAARAFVRTQRARGERAAAVIRHEQPFVQEVEPCEVRIGQDERRELVRERLDAAVMGSAHAVMLNVIPCGKRNCSLVCLSYRPFS